MAGPSRKIGKASGWRSADGKAPPPQIGPRRRWQPGEDSGPRRSGRWVKVLAVLGGLAATAAGIGFLITLLIEPNPPLLVVVGADPAPDALRLDVPPDYAGWTTGQQLIKWGKAEEKAGGRSSLTAKVVATGDNPVSLPTDPVALDGWVDKLTGKSWSSDGRVLIYLGLHGGVDQTGVPFLWVGKGDTLKVGELLSRLADKLARRDVVVLFDPGRAAADPQVGRLADGFADRLAKDPDVKTALDRHPRLVAVCGASPGEAGWESEELQATAFGQAVLHGLRGEGTPSTSAITAGELFDYLKKTTADWSGGNRPTRQTPFLLPTGDAGVQRAGRMVAAYKSATPAAAPAVDPVPQTALADLWKRHDQLAGRPVPPSAYAPLAWRRGRELLVRYQQAVRAGERGAAGALETAVRAEFERVEGSVPAVVDASRSNSLPLAQTFGDQRAADAGKELAKASSAEGLKTVEFDKLRGPGDGRTGEALLACMVDEFYRKWAGGPPPNTWATALTVRQAAERAAFGGGPAGKPTLYPERAWAAVRAEVTAADARRREAEDRLFATPAEDQSKAVAALTEAEAGYAKAAATGVAVRDGAEVRDKLFADLPFLGRWAVASGQPDATQAAITAWETAHKLADALDAPGPTLVPLTADARAADAKLRGQFSSALAALNSPPESQNTWEGHEFLLACPLVPADIRMKALELSGRYTKGLLAGPQQQSGADDLGTRVARAKEAARGHARLTTAALGQKLIDAGHAASDQLPRFTRLEARLGELAEAKEDWTDKAAGIGHDLLGHLRRADTDAAPKEYPSAAKVEEAERASRSAVLLAENRTREPAEVAAALRWQALLVGLADRTARDHWYDEAQEPYWQKAANRYLADARRARRADLPRVAADAVPADYPEARRLTVRPAPGTPDPIAWTSQRRRGVEFQVGVPADFPAFVAGGLAVGWRPQPDGVLRWDADADRRAVAVAPDRGGTLAGTLVLKDGVGEDVAATATPTARLFFRGQRPDGKLTVKVSRRAERIIREPLPPRREAAVAVRADPDVDLGEVAILLDYSGSMKQDRNGGDHPDDYATADTKFKRSQEALRRVLASLPKGTPLRVRIFSAIRDKKQLNEVAFPSAGEPALVTWETDKERRYLELVERLGAYKPFFFTPLADQIKEAVQNDFTFTGPSAGQRKTLVVLTDGVDEREEDGTGTARVASIRKRITEPGGLTAQLQGLFSGSQGKNVALYVVPFGQTKDDGELCKELFKGIDTYDTPGRLWPSAEGAEAVQLEKQLLAAIFPKLQLLEPGGTQPLAIRERSGLPSRLDGRAKLGPPYSNGNGGTDLRWSPWVPAGVYTAQPNPSRGTGPRLALAESDAVVLGFARDGAGGVQVRRELHAEYYPQIPSVTRYQPGGRWVVTSPWPVVERQRLEAVVYVEQVPPHKRTPANPQPPTSISADPPDPKGDGREVVWFDVLPVGPDVPPGRLTVTRLYGHPAPAWKVERDDWTGPDLRSKMRVTVATHEDGLPDPRRETFTLPRQDPEAVTVSKGNTPADDLPVRVSVEPQSPDGQPPAEGKSWLYLRITHPAGRPVFARLVDERLGRAVGHHRYYPKAGDTAEYTAAFQVPTTELGRLADVKVNLADVGWAVADTNRDRLSEPLDPAAPKADRQGEPKTITPASPEDR